MTSWFSLAPELQMLIIEFAIQNSTFFYLPRSGPSPSLLSRSKMIDNKPHSVFLVSREFFSYYNFTEVILKSCHIVIGDPWHLHMIRRTYPRLKTIYSIQLSSFAAEQCRDTRYLYCQDLMLDALDQSGWSVKQVILDLPATLANPLVKADEANMVKLTGVSMKDLYAIMTTEVSNSSATYQQFCQHVVNQWLWYPDTGALSVNTVKAPQGLNTPRYKLELILVEVVQYYDRSHNHGLNDHQWLSVLIDKADRRAFELVLSFYLLPDQQLNAKPAEPVKVKVSSCDWLINLEYMSQKFSIKQD